MRRRAIVVAHIIRDFKGVDPVRYHAAIRLQAEAVPLNVAKNNTRSHGQTAPSGHLTVETSFYYILVYLGRNIAKRYQMQNGILGRETNEEEVDPDIFFDAESEPTVSSGTKPEEISSRFDSSADLFD